MNIKTEVMTITPKQAKLWLERSNTNNRVMRPDTAKKFARDIKNGNWQLTHQGIAFYSDGTIADGQHRLMAVVLADKAVRMSVTRNLPKVAAHAIDQNTPRMAIDTIHIAGGPKWIERNVVAAIRFIKTKMGNHTDQLTVSEILEYALANEDDLRFAIGLISNKKKYITTAGMVFVYYAALRAGESRELLKRFSEVMFSGESHGPHENAAIRLREFLMTNPNCWNGAERLDTAKRAQKAVKVFCQKQPMMVLRTPNEFVYPIPV